jgi:hypothetical protein
MKYEAPILNLLGPAVSEVLGSDSAGGFDRAPESDLRKSGSIEALDE